MNDCPRCGETVGEGNDYCGECGAELADEASPDTDPFLERYGAEPLPLASERGELISIYAQLLGSIPIVGSVLKLFAGISFWCYSVWLKIFTVVTLGADVTNRFKADFNYLKDNFYSEYDGTEKPPKPPQ